ncbi:hypothetical protein BCR32DRAFT_324453 [Anaeromyces robustus]|jgi:hypothetical protein|uniref:Nucleotide-diphospho-sugar transferase n=1 Tax=Anaeromyces robustus TaxID=1754192 RepID=A0A1Y1XNZ5_9FUNG|nr:hypothetical protein BCR32DRAFT_324453 [Anaeromyces robustus]|eukprot:ORX87477.1 hypothetical protein BCR32DRAFT_324453 [Anaeromyces robustus]
MLIIGTVLLTGTILVIHTIYAKERNDFEQAIEDTLDIKDAKEGEHMNMFNNDYEMDLNENNFGDTPNLNNTSSNNNDKIEYNEEAEEQKSKLEECIKKTELLEKKLNDSSINTDKQKELMDTFAYKYLQYDIVFDDFVDLRERTELHTHLWRKIYGDGPYTASTPNLSDVVLAPESLSGEKRLLGMLHSKLYPWLYEKFSSPVGLLRSYKGRGIVICTGSYHYRFAKSTVDTLRNVIKSKLPIEIMYVGESDLSEAHRKDLESYKMVTCTDVTKFFNNDIVFISGWAVKPFAILASRFKEVILIDADAMYIHDPALWFEDEGYKETGALFFKDRTLYPGPHGGSEWLHHWMKDPSDYVKNSRFYNELSSHEMESSTVVIDKSRRLLGILQTCKFNERRIRDRVVYQKVFGDKETYWMAFDMAREPYSVMPHPIVYVGEINYGEDIDDPNQKQLCGHIGHTNREGEIMFWNDHIVKDKHDPKYNNRLLRFEGWFYEDLENVQWTDTFHCANIKDDFPLNEFTAEETEIINKIIEREREKKFVIDAGTSY